MSNLSLERLVFDPSDFADGPTLGSYIVSNGGNVITDTGSALDVNIKTSDIDIQVDIDTSNFVADDAVYTENGMPIGYRAHDAAAALGALSADGDKADGLSDLYRRLYVNDAPNVAVASAAVVAGLTEVALPQLAGRTRLMVQNNGTKPIYVGPTGVTVASGLEVSRGGTLSLECGEGIALFAISGTAAQDVRAFEMG